MLRLRYAVIVLLVALSRVARADTTDPDKLFNEATALMDQQRWADALPKLEAAQRLDPGIGTQFDIALCDEKLNKLASAWANYTSVARLAHASGKKAREDAANAKLAELKPRVPFLRLRALEAGELVVRVDGATVARTDFEFVPVDPGDHKIEAVSPGKVGWSQTVPAPAEGKSAEVVIPELEAARGETRFVTVTKETTNGRRTLGFVLVGVGVIGFAAAAVTGGMILSDKSTADERCAPRCVDQDGRDAVDRMRTLLPINAIAWGVGVVGVGVGAVLVLTSRKKTDAPPAPLGASVVVNGPGAALRVAF